MSNLLQLKSGVKTIGIRRLFEEASFAVNEGEKIGVIGPNGAGKSTLFKILVGLDELDAGEVTKKNGLKIGYLEQEDHWQADMTVETYLTKETVTPIWQIRIWAPQFGLSLDDFSKPIQGLSGGYRMRVKLMRLLAQEPDLMLLDEPTNYLDLETLVVLENFLQNSNRAFMLITHDREFLRRTTDHILEVEDGKMSKFAGTIDDYFEQKELLRQQLLAAQQSQLNRQREILDFASRFGAKATKAKQVQSRLKSLEKMEPIEVRALPMMATIKIPTPARTGKLVIDAEEVTLGYGEHRVIEGLRLVLGRGDHVGVVGHNGAGKSTLLKGLAGVLPPLNGKMHYGMGVEIGYFSQYVAESLEDSNTVLEALRAEAHPDVTPQEVLDLAGALLFKGDDVEKKIRILSGGEKSRVALGKILLRKVSCLLLDEPTNHLDFHTVEALTQAISRFEGAVVVVSHDRGFVRRIATKILEIRDHQAQIYPGSYDEYVWSVQKGVLSELVGGSQSQREKEDARAKANSSSADGEKGDKVNYKEKRKTLEKDLKSLEKAMVALDAEMEHFKTQTILINAELLAASGSQSMELAKTLSDIQNKINLSEEKYFEYMEHQDQLRMDLEALLSAGKGS